MRIIYRFICIIMMCSICMFCFPGKTLADPPANIRLSWQSDPQTTITVTWQTTSEMPGYQPTVEYGSEQGAYTMSAAGSSHSYEGASAAFHQVEMTGLLPDTVYYYRCGDASYQWSGHSSFRTAPASGEAFDFCVMGDSRDDDEPSYVNNDFSIFGEIAGTVQAEGPLFSIHVGDFIDDGNSETKWDEFLEKLEVLSKGSVVMGCHGNHEKYAAAYFERFAFPGNERWYSFDVSNTHFIFLDTGLKDNDEWALLAEQAIWLENDLQEAGANGYDWIVVSFHRPPYATGSHGNQLDVIESWVPIFDEYGVDLVLAGHVHCYERSYPMCGGQVVDHSENYYFEPEGTIYITTGGAGAPLSDPGMDSWVVQNAKEYHYCEFEVCKNRKININVKSRDGDVIDKFTIAKEPAPKTIYFAEGYTGPGFQEYLCLGNPQETAANVWIDYMFDGGTFQQQYVTVPAKSRATIDVNSYVGADKEVSCEVVADQDILVERPLYFNCPGAWSGGHVTMGAEAPADTWYFAEGYTGEGFEEWVCVLNPGDTQAGLTFHFQNQQEGPKEVSGLTVPARSRRTFSVNDLLGAGCQSSIRLESDIPIVAERPMYFDYRGINGDRGCTGGHCVMGATGLSNDYYFAEGTTRPGFEEWLTLQNPNPFDINVEAIYQPGPNQGSPEQKTYPLPANSRRTIFVENEVGRDKDVSVKLSSSSPFLAERPIYFDYRCGDIAARGGHCVCGITAPACEWLFAEGYTGEGFDQWLCLQNPHDEDAVVEVSCIAQGEDIPGAETVLVPAETRVTLMINDHVGPGRQLSCRLQVTSGPEVIVERAMYFVFGGLEGGHIEAGYAPV